jgi:hypothetical protein
MRIKWYPSNGSEGMYLDEYCADCLHDINEDCPLILQSLTANGKDEMPDEWTADDIYGRGFECSKKQTLEMPR